MTLVHAETGEVVAEFTPDEAREFTDRLNAAVGIAGDMVVEAWTRRIWTALGYTSWEAYCAHEVCFELNRESKAVLMVGLRKAGASYRAIGAAAGVSHEKARTELSGVKDLTPDVATGTDGKTYPARRPEPVPEPEDTVEAPTPEVLDEEPEPETAEQQAQRDLEESDIRAARRLTQILGGWHQLRDFHRHLRRDHVLALLDTVTLRNLTEAEEAIHG